MPLTISPTLASVSNLRHGFTNHTLSAGELAEIAARAQLLKQVHGDHLVWVDEPSAVRPEADAIATFAPGLAIAAQSADCVPLLLAALDEQGKPRGILAVHAGWRGSSLGIAASALREFLRVAQEKFRVAKLVGAIGPCISGEVYEVGAEVAERFSSEVRHAAGTKDGDRKYFLDLELENSRQAEAVAREFGVPLTLDRLKSCTWSQPALYPSYRRDGAKAGRIISFIELR